MIILSNKNEINNSITPNAFFIFYRRILCLIQKFTASSTVSGVDRVSSLLNFIAFRSTKNVLYKESPANIIKDDKATPPIASRNFIAVCFIGTEGEQNPGSAVNIITATGIINF